MTPNTQGVLLAILAAATFGATTPIVQLLADGAGSPAHGEDLHHRHHR